MAATLTPFPKFRAFNSNGDPLVGGKLYTFEPVTSTPKATYVNSAGVTPNTNPVILDASGQANVWLTGLYTFRLDSAMDVTQWTVDNVGTPSASADPFSILSRDYGNDLAAAVAAIGATKTTLLITAPTTLAANLTVPDTLLLVITRAGLITVNGGFTLTLTNAPEAGPYTIFSGAGVVTWANGASVWAEWWGAEPGVNSANAITSALNASTKNMHVKLNEGTFLIGAKITVPTGIERDWRLVGRGLRTTYLQRTAGYAGPLLEIGSLAGNNGRFIVSGIGFDGLDAATGTVGIRVLRAGAGQICDCLFENLRHGYFQTSGVSNTIRDCRFEDCAYGTVLENGANTPTMFGVVDTSYRNCTIASILIDGTTNASGLLRNIQFDRVTFESDTVTSGTEIGLHIKVASQIHIRECWFESQARFVTIEGGEDARLTGFIKFDTCNFGVQNPNAIDPIAFRFVGTGSRDGIGCEITNSGLLGSGPFATVDFAFNQTVPMIIRGSPFLGDVRGTGDSWVSESVSLQGQAVNYEDLVAKTLWKIRRINKQDLTPEVLFRGYEHFATGTTAAGAGITTIETFSPNDNAAIFVEAMIVAKSASGGAQAAYKLGGLFRDNAGAVTLIGAVQSIMTAVESDAAWDATMDASGATIRFRCLGDAAAIVRWAIWFNVLQISEEP